MFTQLKIHFSDVVYNIQWTYSAISDKLDEEGNPYKAELIGTSPVGKPNPANFYEFLMILTQVQVEEWLASDKSIANIQEAAESKLEEIITPVSIAKDVPW
eukprot:TRINITY_DN460_c0_g1_i1.p1 TRINITY_DN460_c0_g1~~TRINITY_DN460_c0_g1_i1.p1  ORF type:complete len:101 (-),score=16.23 TRINITY_DN460_c0_g1_i1:470-772(-)